VIVWHFPGTWATSSRQVLVDLTRILTFDLFSVFYNFLSVTKKNRTFSYFSQFFLNFVEFIISNNSWVSSIMIFFIFVHELYFVQFANFVNFFSSISCFSTDKLIMNPTVWKLSLLSLNLPFKVSLSELYKLYCIIKWNSTSTDPS
jgi:hypothetical protein